MNARTTAVGLRRATPWRAKCAAGASLMMVLSLATLVSSATPSFASTHLTSANGSATASCSRPTTRSRPPRTKPSRRRVRLRPRWKRRSRIWKPEEPSYLASRPRHCRAAFKLLFENVKQALRRPGGRELQTSRSLEGTDRQFRGFVQDNGRRVKQDHGLRQERLRREGLTAFVVPFQPVVHSQ